MEVTPLEHAYVAKIASHKVFSSKLLSPISMPVYFVKIILNKLLPFRSYSLFLFLKGHVRRVLEKQLPGRKPQCHMPFNLSTVSYNK